MLWSAGKYLNGKYGNIRKTEYGIRKILHTKVSENRRRYYAPSDCPKNRPKDENPARMFCKNKDSLSNDKKPMLHELSNLPSNTATIRLESKSCTKICQVIDPLNIESKIMTDQKYEVTNDDQAEMSE